MHVNFARVCQPLQYCNSNLCFGPNRHVANELEYIVYQRVCADKPQSIHLKVSIYSKLYTSIDINNLISKYLEKYLVYLKNQSPPTDLSDVAEHWPEDLIERCLALALAILPQNANVLRDLAKIYIKTKSTDVQKTILRALGPFSTFFCSMDSVTI